MNIKKVLHMEYIDKPLIISETNCDAYFHQNSRYIIPAINRGSPLNKLEKNIYYLSCFFLQLQLQLRG